MARLILTRLLTLIPLMFLVTSVVFFLVRFVPGDPARIMTGGQRISEENLANIRAAYRLDQPLLTQYRLWVGDLLQGNLGRSYRQRTEVTTLIVERLPLTAKLAGLSFALALIIALPLGVLAAVHRNSWIDVAATMFAVLVASSPVFFTGILLILVFSYQLGWLPALGAGDGGWDTLLHLFLPSLTLGLSLAAITTRITRSSMVEALTQDYIETARAKGLPTRTIILKHAFRNALVPVVTVFGLLFGFLIVGTVLVEHTFGLGGLGSLLIDAVQVRDYPVVQGATIFIAGLFIIINLVVDVLYAVIDPRVRFGGKA
ncbi:MAG: ABC-type dipeptide/oligopeptide/nickel transport system, permease component [Thermomicrobiales bacterium]|nr:ABC-type dipeptide/oligopeptide/nickel transport system, permease component [Thermomicrobiales bacterium]